MYAAVANIINTREKTSPEVCTRPFSIIIQVVKKWFVVACAKLFHKKCTRIDIFIPILFYLCLDINC